MPPFSDAREVKETKINPTMLASRKGLYAVGLLGLLVLAGSAIAFLHPVHAGTTTTTSGVESTVDSAVDPDQAAACTGSGDNQQGECDTQSGDQNGPDLNSASEILG
jgi:hypothetical protein